MDYYIVQDNIQYGPCTLEQARALCVGGEQLVWRTGMTQWQRADALPELQDLFRHPNPSTRWPDQPSTGPTYTNTSSTGPQAPRAGTHPHMAQPVSYYNTAYYPASNVNGTKLAAGICGILFGAFCIHKFIAGLAGPGVAMLFITILGSGLTCGTSGAIMWLFGVIEGIIYLTRTDDQFYNDYLVGKKGWF